MCLTGCCLAAFGLKGKEARTQACEQGLKLIGFALNLLDWNNGHFTEITK